MTQGYERGVKARKIAKRVINPYPEWCAESNRFEAGRYDKPDPNDAK